MGGEALKLNLSPFLKSPTPSNVSHVYSFTPRPPLFFLAGCCPALAVYQFWEQNLSATDGAYIFEITALSESIFHATKQHAYKIMCSKNFNLFSDDMK